MKTGFFVDEKCFWHSGGNYALMAPVGGLVQPLAAGGLPEWSNGFCLLAGQYRGGHRGRAAAPRGCG